MLLRMIFKNNHLRILKLFLIFVVSPVFAEGQGSFGDIANTLLEPVNGISNIVKFLCATVGCGIIMASIVKFKEYLQHTTDMGLLSILTLFIVGLALLMLSFLPMF